RDITGPVGAAAKRHPRADQRFAELAARRDPEAPVVDIRAGALFGPEHLVAGRLVDETGDDLAVALQGDRDCEMRDAVEKIGRAVERVDDPAVMRVAAFAGAAFLEQEAVAGAGAQQLGAQRPLGPQISGRDKIAGAL